MQTADPTPQTNSLPRPHADAVERLFVPLMMGTSVVGGLTHLAFIFLFASAGVHLLAVVNVASVLVYLLGWMLLRARRTVPALLLVGAEVVSHAALASWMIGWDSGYYYYLMLTIPVVIVSQLPGRWKAVMVLLVGTTHVAIDVALRGAVPLAVVSPQMLTGLYYFNLVTTLGILTFLVANYFRMVTRADARLRHIAETDPLTRLLNRRSILDLAQGYARRGEPQREALSLILGDVDHFKAVNDNHGHEAGDSVLLAVSAALLAELRDEDRLARWGGEEFLILLPAIGLEQAAAVAERLRQRVAAVEVVLPTGQRLSPSMTFGIAAMRPGEPLDAAIARADAALYAGKRAGRNRVEQAAA